MCFLSFHERISSNLECRKRGVWWEEYDMMIDKVINNNIISVIDKTGEEVLIMGRGIGFKGRPGMPVDEKKIQKIFRLESPAQTKMFQDIIEDMPMEHIQVSSDIIGYAKTVIESKLNRSIYLTLTDHINFALERFEKGMNLKNALLWEIKKFYPKEYLVGKQALVMIKEQLQVELPEDEAGSIAMHFVNAELNSQMNETVDITKVIQSVLDVIKYHFQINLNESSLDYERLVTHLKFFAQRIIIGKHLKEEDEDWKQMIFSKYAEEYECAIKVRNLIQKIYHYEVDDNELMYLTLHIRRVTGAGE